MLFWCHPWPSTQLQLSCNTYVNNMSNIRQKDLSNYDAIFKLKCIGFNNICTHVEYIHSIFIAHLSTVSNPKNQIMIMIPESGIHGVSLRDAWRRAKWLAVNVTLPSCLTSQRTFFNTRNKQFWVTIMPFYWSVIFSNFLLKYWKKENENTEIILYHQISTLSHVMKSPGLLRVKTRIILWNITKRSGLHKRPSEMSQCCKHVFKTLLKRLGIMDGRCQNKVYRLPYLVFSPWWPLARLAG